MCVTCVDGCIGMCEISKSAYRGHEVLYPQPFGIITSASEKEYPVDLSHFNIMGTAVGAYGVEANSDKAIFPKVTIERAVGHDKGIKLKVPFILGAMGLYTYFKRLSQGLRQLMAGNRKFALNYITRNDIAALTQDAANISGIPYITDVDKEEVDKILNS